MVESVKSIRRSVAGMLEGKVTAGRLAEWMEGRMPARYADTWQLLRTLPPSQIDKASAYRVVSGVYQAAGGKRYDPPRKLYSLRNKDNKGSNLFFSESRDELLTKAKACLQSRRKNHRRKVMKKQHRHRMTKSALTYTGIPAVAIFLLLTAKTKCG